MSLKQISIVVLSVALLVGVVTFSSSILETNDSGNYQVKQAAVSGDMTVRTSPGTYGQLFGDIHTYKVSDMNYFSKHDLDGGDSPTAEVIKVRFNDGGTAEISGSLKFRLSTAEADQLKLHEEFKSYRSVQNDLIRQTLTEALKQTAALMRAEESYSTRRSEFTTLAEAQVEKGIFETNASEVVRKDAEGNEFVDRTVEVMLDKDGNPVVRKVSPLLRYNIEVLQFTIKDIDFDKTIDALIAKKKEAEQAKVVAKSNAERAKQDTITEFEQGQARIAKAKANEEVAKITAVTQAEKDFEVAKFNRKRAEEDAKAQLVVKEAEAKAAKLLVSAGLTPLDRANIEMQTSIEVAKALANITLPTTFVAGGSGKNGSALDPFTAIGLESMINISRKMSTSK